LSETPIIMITASSDEEVKRRAHEAGATAYFEKPFSPLALLKEIETLQRRSGHFPVRRD
jgi:DNA-binding response OmpR family regulator